VRLVVCRVRPDLFLRDTPACLEGEMCRQLILGTMCPRAN